MVNRQKRHAPLSKHRAGSHSRTMPGGEAADKNAIQDCSELVVSVLASHGVPLGTTIEYDADVTQSVQSLG